MCSDIVPIKAQAEAFRQRHLRLRLRDHAAVKAVLSAAPPTLPIAVRYSLSSLSISSIVGSVPFNFSGRAAASWYSEIPIGLETSRNAYSATKRSRVLQRIRPMLGWSCGWWGGSLTEER